MKGPTFLVGSACYSPIEPNNNKKKGRLQRLEEADKDRKEKPNPSISQDGKDLQIALLKKFGKKKADLHCNESW